MAEKLTDSLEQAPTQQASLQQASAQHEATHSGSAASKPGVQASADSPTSSKKRKRDDSEATDTADSENQMGHDDAMLTASTASEPGMSAAEPLPSSFAPPLSSLSMAKSPSTGSVHAHSSVDKHDAETTHAADAKSGDDGDVVWRSREQLAVCLSCDLCKEILSDPVTAPECMHSYCRDCIDKHVLFGGTKNLCPVCKQEGLETVLGTQPFQHGKLQFDPMLADMIKKLFPRAEVEKGIQERQDAEAKWRASLPVKKQKPAAAKPARQKSPAAAKQNAGTPGAQHKQAASSVAAVQTAKQSVTHAVDPKVTLFLELDQQQCLSLPYLRVDRGLSFGLLASFIGSQLRLNADLHAVDLYCEGVLLPPVGLVNSAVQQWLVQHGLNEAILIKVRTRMR